MKKIINISLGVMSVAGLLTMMGFVHKAQKKIFCEKVDVVVNYDDGNFFVEKEDILKMIKQQGTELTGKPVSAINLHELENIILYNPSVDKAEVYTTISGVLKIDISQRRPIVRIMGSNVNKNYYIDENGNMMPLSNNYAARVLIASGHINQNNIGDIFKLALYVDKNLFWNSQVQQIYITLNGEIVLIPRVGKHKIIFGDVTDMEEKFEKLMIFYKKGLNKIGWNRYKIINLKFKDQIVCIKNF